MLLGYKQSKIGFVISDHMAVARYVLIATNEKKKLTTTQDRLKHVLQNTRESRFVFKHLMFIICLFLIINY